MPTLAWKRQAALDLESAAELRGHWNRLNAERLDLPFLDAEAVAAALRVFGRGDEQLLTAFAAEQPVAMFLLAPAGAMRWGTFQPSQMPLGAWVAARGLPLQDLCDSLIRGPLGLCLVLSITQVDPLMAPRADDESCSWHADYIDTAWVDIEGSFDTYWAARGKNLRQNMRKQRNRLNAEAVATEMRMLREPGDMEAALARYGELETRGWKSGTGTAISADNDQGRFYLQLLLDAARRGEAVVFEYLIGGKTAAMNLCLRRNGVLVVLKTGYDESLPKTLSPAFLLREEELQHLFAAGEVRRIEYYGRVMDWHTKLTDQKRTLYHLTRYRWPFLKGLIRRLRPAEARPAKDPQPPSQEPSAQEA